MNVLIACHCKKQKLKITKFPLEGNVLHPRIYKKYGIQKLDYVNIEGCEKGRQQYVDWESIPSSSVDRIWLMNCPIYCLQLRFKRIVEGVSTFNKEEQQFQDDMFQEGWRILKPGGKIVVPSTNIDKKYEMMRFGFLVAQKPNPWLLSVKNIKDTEFQIDSPTHDFDEDDYHIFIEKPQKRKTRKHLKSKSIKNKHIQ